MKNILVLKSSLNGDSSLTNTLIDEFLAKRRLKGLNDNITERDLTRLSLPVLDQALFGAMRGAPAVDAQTAEHVALSDQLIDELKQCDLLLIGAPMYNLNVPTPLKNWFDLVSRAGQTFRYTEGFPQGLVEGVNAVVFSSRGGVHVGYDTDAVTPYLRAVLRLLGIDDVNFVYAEGIDIDGGRERGITYAREQIRALA